MRTLVALLMGFLLFAGVPAIHGQDTPPDSTAQRPTIMPFTERPEIRDQREAQRIVERYYPTHLRDAGIGGTVNVWVFIDTDGRVRNTQLAESSGNKELDEAATAAVREIRFAPARNLGEVVPLWYNVPIIFRDVVERPSGPVVERAAGLAPLSEVVAASTPQFGCEPPIGVYWRQLAAAVPIDESLAGDYALTVVAIAGFQNDTIAYGTLWLRPTDLKYRQAPNPDITYPLYGASDIDLTSLGPVSLAHSPASRNQDNPGVYTHYYSGGPSLDLVFGASPVTLDAGVIFDVFSIDSLGFSGRWMDGGFSTPRLEGYYCARRLTALK